MNRRDALKILGLGTLTPSLFVEKRKIVGRRFEGERIPTGFRLIDAAISGGMRPGEICTIYGDAPTPLLHSIAMNMGKHASVALVTRQPCLNEGYKSYDGTVYLFRASIPTHHLPGSQWNFITRSHDVVVMDGDHSLHNRFAFAEMARQNECIFLRGDCASTRRRRIARLSYSDTYRQPLNLSEDTLQSGDMALVSFRPLYLSDYMICVEDQKFPKVEFVANNPVPIGFFHMGQLYSAALVKNVYGPRCVSPIVLLDGRFVEVEDADYWECTSQEVQTYMPIVEKVPFFDTRIVSSHKAWKISGPKAWEFC